MENSLVAQSTITINASAEKVWEALTNPELIKQYFFGTQAVSDWKVGSSLIFKGEWEGKPYEDKGTILELEPQKLLVYTHFSGASGQPDVPENYHKVTYELSSKDGQTTVAIMNDNNATEEARQHSEQNWGMVLKNLKQLLEGHQ